MIVAMIELGNQASLTAAQTEEIDLTISGGSAASGFPRHAGSANSYIQASAEL